MAKEKPKMISPKQYAEQLDVPYQTVMLWLRSELIPGAEKEELPSGGWFYRVPADAPRPETKRGPKPKKEAAAKPAKRARKKGEQ